MGYLLLIVPYTFKLCIKEIYVCEYFRKGKPGVPESKLPLGHGNWSCFFIGFHDTRCTGYDRLANLAIRAKQQKVGILVPQEPDAII